MKYLIDTQILIWYQLNDRQLSPKSRTIIDDGANKILVSQVSLFEIAIKQKIGKLPEIDASMQDLLKLIEQDDFDILQITNQHIAYYEQVPLLEEHKDPFDKLIIATAMQEKMPIISADAKFTLYKDLITLIEN